MSSISVSTPLACGGDAGAAMATQGYEQALLASDRYARLILAQINKMRLRTDFCDVGLKVGEQVFRVHRLVLAASSPYFSALFSGGMREADKEEVQILGVDTVVFEVLLDFIYTGSYQYQYAHHQIHRDLLHFLMKLYFFLHRSDQRNCGERSGADGGSRHAAAKRGGVYLWRVSKRSHGPIQLRGRLSVSGTDCLCGNARVY